jgi:molybdenum cofactor guanylyltransferase
MMVATARRAPGRDAIAGLVLAGGLSRRMGGVDKALLHWRGQPLLAHTLAVLAPQVACLLVSHNRGDAELLALATAHAAPCLPDTRPGHLGPLAGVLAALEHLAQHGPACPWLATLPCDVPKAPADLVARLAAAAGTSGLAIAASRNVDHSLAEHPTCMLVHQRLRPTLEAALAAGEQRVRAWAQAQGAAVVVFDDAEAFANVNTPADLAALAELRVAQPLRSPS